MKRQNTPIFYATLKDREAKLKFPKPRKLGEVQEIETLLKDEKR